ncbi:hypothetical protein OIU84_013556 [Salix udensis]|uniref:Dynamin N-terminal domain-containing protein n=1 Tax=Salix udensis TaxID=889485 RepID=A0AAD6JK46_9ROSI|nr:hypothetical protein OIU84_013556 [Salix udensis]
MTLDSEDVIRGGSEASDLIDKAVSKSVGIVVLNGCSDGGGGSGKSLYEAACLVKSVVRDRAYLLIGERVDIAAAVNASGVVVSDQGLPSIVARNMLMGSKSGPVVLPLVARIVQTPNAALNASNSEDKNLRMSSKAPASSNHWIWKMIFTRKQQWQALLNWRIEKNSSSKKRDHYCLKLLMRCRKLLLWDIHWVSSNQKRYLNEGVVPTTNDITFICYSKGDSEEQQRHERHPDGQYICYLPAPILKEMNIVDTPGTNVILQRQQRLTEEFVPRADLLLFVFSADKPLTESEVAFLRYIQQWKKKVVFVLNKSDIYRNSSELEEDILFIKENTRKLLNTDDVILYPISARSALEAKLSASSDTGKEYSELSVSESHLKITRFYELEQFLYSFLDASTTTGMERIRLTLETPIAFTFCL